MKLLPPLRYSVPGLLGILGFILVLLAFFDGLQRSESLIESESRGQLLTFGTRIAARLEQLYFSRDSRAINELLVRMTSEPHLLGAVVVDANGNVIESANTDLLGKSLADYASPWATTALASSLLTGSAAQSVDAQGSSLDAIFPITLPPNRGELRSHRYVALFLHSDLSETKRLNLARHVERAWIMAAVVAVTLALVWIYFHWAVTKRLQRLSNAMQHMAFNEGAESSTEVTGNDEIGRLSARFSSMVKEIRQRRNALIVSEERHRSVVQALSEGIVMMDSTGQIIAANESAAQVVGLTHDGLTGRAIFDPNWRVYTEDGKPLAPQDFPSAITLRTGEILKGKTIGVVRSDGELRWLSVHSVPLWLDVAHSERGCVSTLIDITDQREVEQEARRDRERLAAIVDSAMDGVISVDGLMRITVFNRAAEKMFGRIESTMIGERLDVLLPVRHRGSHLASMENFAASGTTVRAMGMTGKIVGLHADGTEFPLEASIARVSVGDETILTVMLRDLSEQTRAQVQRSQLEAQLRQSQKMQSLGTLTGGIAHDFNNILTAITGNAKLAISDLPRTHPVQRSLVEIEKAALRATALVRQVLAFGRRQEAQRTVVDLAVVIGEALSFLRAMIPTTVEIRSRFAEGLPQVAVDKTQMHQVITNLGSNAAHAIGDRPGTIDVQIDEVEIRESDLQRPVELRVGRYVRVAFSDDGSGIDAALHDRIFEPFFTTKGLGQGTGLGLSVVHGILKNHDGAITVHSTRGVGSRFELYFPACEQTVSVVVNEPRQDADSALQGRGKTVIYVDDEEALVFLITRILERSGYTVLGFNHPQHAITELAKNPQRIDALISDLAMPGMTGFDVAREALAIRADLPTILVSGYIRPQDVETARVLGIERLILKPDTVDALASSLHELLTEDSTGSVAR